MFSVTALGESLIDFTDGYLSGGQKLLNAIPEAHLQTYWWLERLGKSTAFIGKVGADMHGDFLRATL